MRNACARAWCACVLSAVLALPASARAGEYDVKAQCVEASERGQDLRDGNSYTAARQAFARCAAETCPNPLRGDCVAWLDELNQRFPSVVIVARGARGDDLDAVRVLLDGQVLTARVDGALLPVDPGMHVFRYESPGTTPAEERVVIQPGEKGRRLTVTLRPIEVPPPPVVTPAPTSRPFQGWGWALAGVSVLGFASEAYFGFSGLAQRSSDLSASGCAPHCSQSEAGAIQTKFAIADASLAVGVVSGAAALYFLLRRPETRPPPRMAAIDFVPTSGGLMGVLRTELP